MKAWQEDLGVAETGRLDSARWCSPPGRCASPPTSPTRAAPAGRRRLGDRHRAAGRRRPATRAGRGSSRSARPSRSSCPTARSCRHGAVGRLGRDARRPDAGHQRQHRGGRRARRPAPPAGSTRRRSTCRSSRCRPSDALAVPVEALLALAEGGYAVERADGSPRRLSTPAPSPTATSRSCRRRAIDEGDQVVVPVTTTPTAVLELDDVVKEYPGAPAGAGPRRRRPPGRRRRAGRRRWARRAPGSRRCSTSSAPSTGPARRHGPHRRRRHRRAARPRALGAAGPTPSASCSSSSTCSKG